MKKERERERWFQKNIFETRFFSRPPHFLLLFSYLLFPPSDIPQNGEKNEPSYPPLFPFFQIRDLEVRGALRGPLLRPASPPRPRQKASHSSKASTLGLPLWVLRRLHGDNRRLLHAAAGGPAGGGEARGRRRGRRGRRRRGLVRRRRSVAAAAAAVFDVVIVVVVVLSSSVCPFLFFFFFFLFFLFLQQHLTPAAFPPSRRPLQPGARHLGRGGPGRLPSLPPADPRGPGESLGRRRRRVRVHRRRRRRARGRGRRCAREAPQMGRDDERGQGRLRGALRDPDRR